MSDYGIRFAGGDPGYVSLDGRNRVIGIGTTPWAGSNTRYVKVNSRQLVKWAEAVDNAASGGSVYVGVTPDAPMVAKPDKESAVGILVSPLIDKDDGGD